MSITFPVAPTYASPIENDDKTGQTRFNPLWLQWFLDCARYLTAVGQGGSAINHNNLLNLQGGSTGEFYHFASGDYTALSGARTTKGINTTDDLVVDLATKGLVLKDIQGTPHYWRVTVSVLGVLQTADLGTTPP